jgi:hypothetical protein
MHILRECHGVCVAGPPHCPPPGWTVNLAGSVSAASSQPATGTLADCRDMCQNGSWSACAGFSRPNDVWPTQVSNCSWVNTPTLFVLDVPANNEDLNIVETTRVPPGWTIE